MSAKYVYGITRDSREGPLGMVGLRGAQIQLLVSEKLGCIFSDWPDDGFDCTSKEELVRSLLAHQLVLERAMETATVLPAKLGSLLASSDEIRELLSRNHRQLLDALATFDDKVEVEVAATWDTRQVLQEIGREEEIIRAREAIAGNPGSQTLEQRIRLGQAVKASMDRRRDSYQERMVAALRPLSVDVQPNGLVSDEMVMNVAFLVRKMDQENFESCVRQLNEQFCDRISFRLVGPLPPYSFATIELARTKQERREEARQILGIDKELTAPRIRAAYRRMAAQCHPDRRPGDEQAAAHFAKLREASELLIAYCRDEAGAAGELSIRLRRPSNEDLQHVRLAQ